MVTPWLWYNGYEFLIRKETNITVLMEEKNNSEFISEKAVRKDITLKELEKTTGFISKKNYYNF